MKTKRLRKNRFLGIIGLFLLGFIFPSFLLADSAGTITLSVTLEAKAGVAVTAPSGQSGNPKQTLIYLFTLQNTGDRKDTFYLSVRSGWRSRLPDGRVVGPLASGEKAMVKVEITIPRRVLAGVKDLLTLKARSGVDRRVSGSASVTTTANQVARVRVIGFPRVRLGRPGQTLTYFFLIGNRGNGKDSFDLTAVSSHGWKIVLSEGDVVGPLAPRRWRWVKARLIIPRKVRFRTSDRMTLEARSHFDNRVSDRKVVTTIVRRVR